ncbi:MAG: non-canonical purine NTP pyrophosphatase [Phycisphaeraceae bacterium]|nr:non-canonical purine NTP pyrophosphatase [Phycisphaeraceae bacterium]
MKIVLATGNQHKTAELRAVLAGEGLRAVELVSLADLGRDFPEPAEIGATFAENARIKATAYAALTGFHCLADDSGLEIDALEGRPGVISSHYCTQGLETGMARGERDERNNRRVMHELEGVPLDRRAARFVCEMALASPEGRVLATSRGTMEGRIGTPDRVPRGAHGFGYDPLFLVAPDFASTSAELEPKAKNALSHRGEAARRMAAELRRITAV